MVGKRERGLVSKGQNFSLELFFPGQDSGLFFLPAYPHRWLFNAESAATFAMGSNRACAVSTAKEAICL